MKSDINLILNNAIYFLDNIPKELEDKGYGSIIWNTVNKYFGIRTIFGSQAIHAEMADYIEIIQGKSFIWLGEGSCNFVEEDKKSKGSGKKSTDVNKSKFVFVENFKMAFGVVKFSTILDDCAYSTVTLLVVTDSQKRKWVVDGTLQQFYKGMKKGLVILPYDKAKELYLSLEVYNKEDFAELYGDTNISEKFIEKAKKIEKKKIVLKD